ncbi:amino acid adenylation domain-containing protein [Sorangium sp. So ce1128]
MDMDALDLLASCTTLVGLLRYRATEQPDRLAYTFLLDGETQETTLTYAQLDRRARAVGATLESRGARGERVLLLYPPGIEYTVAVLGCLYAGAVAVPAYPPDPARLGRTLPRLKALIADARASLALTTRDILPMASFLAEQSEELKALRWLATDDVDDGAADAWREPAAGSDTLAVLQYTSGSTAAPRGVMLTHGNLLHNSAAIHRCFEHTSESRGVIWLPPYHDMGLIGGVLQPLCGGFPVVLMSPIDFLRRPFRWLLAISRYRATTSGGPNFAYDLCVRKITPEQIAALDLSSWSLAFNGAEPIRAETLDRFAATFAPCGFRREALYPCYGLAEATLIVSGGSKERSPTVRAFDREQLQRSRAVEEPVDQQGGDTRSLVGCGQSIPGHEVLIVDPDSMAPAPPGRLGEIWVAGASVAQGYWGRPEETAETFGARLRGRDGTFLRTGDLGFLQGGELFVAGRRKDLIILRGRNHYPQDIELTVEQSHPAVRRGCSAAFSVEAAAEERLVVVAEIDASRAVDVPGLVAAVRGAVAEQHDLQAHAVVLLEPGGIPKTSSGKVQRRACRAGFLSGELAAVTTDVLSEGAHGEPETGAFALTHDMLRSAAPEDRQSLLEEYLSRQIARALGIAPSRLDRGRALSTLGLDSIQSIELKNAVEADLGLTVPMSSYLAAPSVADMAAQLLLELERSPGVRPDPIQPVPREGGVPLSFAQERFWFLDRLQPGSPAHTLVIAALLEGPLDATALAQSFDSVVRRHESLRTTFPTAADGAPLQVVAAAAPPGEALLDRFGELVDLGGLPAGERDAAWRRLARAEARRPFDLAEGPLLRTRLVRLAEREHLLLLTIHHIVSDGWSMGILVRELAALYEGFRDDRPPRLLDLPIQYADFAVWQRRRQLSLEADLAYWRGKLGGSLPVLDLPSDRPRPPLRTTLGATRCAALPGDLCDALRAVCRREEVTLFMLLLAAFNALLHRYTGQDDIVVGSPIAGRDSAETEGLIGCFINMLALRTDLSGAPTFLELLSRVRETTLGAYAHQELPFERLVEALRPDRDPSRTPIFQAVFILQNAPMPALALGDLKLTPLETGTGGAAFDVTMTVTERAEGMQIALEYSADLFEEATIGRMLEHFRALLAGLAADPAQRISELPLLGAEERHEICVAWNQTARTIDQDACIHHLIEAAARRRPRAGAVICGDQRLDNEALDRRSNQLAHHLRRRGVGPGALVGICVERSLDMVVGLLGILKAGGAYVPLDPAYPRERLSFIMADAQLSVLVTAGRAAEALPDEGVARVRLDADRAEIERERATPPDVATHGGSLAYVIYTSGSTGKPKGVEITHRSLINFLTSMQERPGLGERDRLLAVTSLSFDIAALEIFLPLSVGALLDVASRELSMDGAALAEHLARAGITVVQATPATFRLLLGAGWEGSRDLKILVGGEAVPRELADALVDRAASVWNMYGPTETTIWSCVHPIAKGTGPVPIGRPIANTRVYVLSDRLQPLPVGIPGELYIGGAGLARGYHRRPDLTAERFIRDPFAAEPDARLYRTGDLVKWSPDGDLEFLGRLDHQVKVRGFRIELGEIEAVLGAHPTVGQAVVVSREDERGERCLVAYLTARGSASPTPGELRAHLQEKLPEYMIPSAFVALEAMPLTPNGKVDRRALPAPSALRRDLGEALVAPRTPVEEALAGIWAHVLGLERVGAHDDFFGLGGHSLLATQVLARVRSAFGIELPLRALFEAPTLAGLAGRVEEAQRAGARIHRPPLQPAGREGALPLSFAQQRLWFLAQLEPDSAFYNVPGAVRVQGPLDRVALEESFQEVVRRHEVLRTTFAVVDGTPRQVIAPDARLPFEVIDLRALPGRDQEAEVRRLAAEEARRPFDLGRGPLARATLLHLDDAEHVLLLTMHHIASDGWSVGVLLREISALYGAFSSQRPSPLPALPVQYADFAIWQRRWLTDEVLEEQLSYWRRQLGGADEPGSGGSRRGPVPALELPTDRPRPAAQTYRGAAHAVRLSADLSAGLRALCQREGATLFMALLAAVQLLLHRYSGQTDIAVGSPIAGRTQTELEGLIGFFANTLVLRSDLSGDPTFLELLRRAREVTLAAHANQDVPFERLVDALKPERDLSRSPLFQVMFALQNAPAQPISIPGLTLTSLEVDSATAKFDLTLSLTDTAEGIEGTLEYNTDLFDARTAARMQGHLEALLEAVVQEPERRISRVPLLSAAERQEILVAWNDATAAYPEGRRIHELFEEQARRTPEAAALIFGEQTLTYGELARRANQLAHHLIKLGVRPEALVAISVERSLDTVIGILGILKAGGAFVPLDPAYPRDRLALMLNDTRARLVLTQRALLPLFSEQEVRVVCLDADRDAIAAIAHEGVEGPAVEGTARHLAYVIYTSGSTGKPKGVLVEHAGLCNLAVAQARAFGVRPGGRVLQLASPSFDASVSEVFMALVAGAALCLPPPGVLAGAELARTLREQAIEVVTVPPALLSTLAPERFPALRTLAVAGEACPPELARRWAERARLINAYGPTEITVCATWHEVAPDGRRPPIGKPLANTRALVLDAHMQPAPIGVPGDLYLGGVGVARGYLNRPELTAERFVPDPFAALWGEPGARLYRTGDRARWLPDGTLDFLGRLDGQVKIRGFRVELGEIEATLAAHPGVLDVAVIAREEAPGDRRLVAYWSAREAPGPSAGELRRHLKERLPEYMVPSAFVAVEAMPLTPAGKIDRRALPSPEAARSDVEGAYVAPQTPAEEMIAGIWAETLGVPRVGAQDDFFALGGHSLLATQALARLNASFGIVLPLRALFEAPTVAALAGRVEAARRRSERAAAPPLLPVARGVDDDDDDDDAPLSFGQQRLWFLSQLEPDSAFYNVPAAVRIRGELDTEALGRSLREIAVRHEVLRTSVVAVQGQPRQVVAPEPGLAVPLVDLGALAEAERERQVERRAADEAQRPFDLASGPLWRAQLLRLGDKDHVLLLTMHHIVSDGWSVGVLLKELTALYTAFRRGMPSPLPALPVQYGDFAVWQRRWLEGEAREEQLAYWKRQLAGAPPSLELPTDRPRPAMQRFRGATHPFQLPTALAEGIERLSRRLGVTPFMTFLAAFQLLLARHAGVDEVCVGTPVAGRNRTELEALIGLFVNTLVLRTDLSGDPSFEQLLARVREVSLGAYEHQDVPFDQVVDALQPPRDLGRTPLFQVAFALQNVPLPALSLDELTLSPLLAESNTSKFDLSLTLASLGQGMQAWLEFNTDLFDGATIARMAGHYLALLESAAREPSQPLSRLRMLPEPERDELLRRWNPAPPPLDVPQLHRRFEAHATRRPDAEAVVAGQLAPVSYGALNRRANQVARELILTAGVRPGDRVALGAARADEALVGLLAILKAGAAVALATDGRVTGWALTAEWMAARADGIAAREESDLPIDLPAEAAAVVANGCSIDHLTVGHALDALAHALDLASSDRLWVEGGGASDGCIQLLLAVVAGAAVVASDRPEADSHGAGATVAWLSSSTLDALALADANAPALADASALRAVALTAPCAPELLARFSHCRIVPVHQVLPGLWLLEEPQPGLERYLLDQLLMPVPVGVTAELYLAAGLSPDAPEATARFCPHPFSPRPGALLYRTGERARYTASGRLQLHDARAAAAAGAAATTAAESQEFVPPRTPIEQTLAQFWREVLSVERVSVHDNFFLLGGNSLLSMLVLHRIHESLQVEVPIHRLFETPTLAALASLIQTEQDAARDLDGASTQQRSAHPAGPSITRADGSRLQLLDQLETLSDADVDALLRVTGTPRRPAVAPATAAEGRALLRELLELELDAPRILPLSFAQQRLWFLDQLEPNSPFYNIPAAVRIRGALDVAVLERSLREIAVRHEVLRTSVVAVQGQPRQVVAPEPGLAVPLVDLGALAEAERERQVERRAADEAQRPFDLASGPLWRAQLLRLGDKDHVLLLTMHHIVSDGWSVGVLLKELTALYTAFRRGMPSPLPALPVQYGDFAVWQRRWLEGEAREEQLAYWKRQLAGAPPSLELPTDRPRPAMQRFRGATHPFQLPTALAEGIERLSRRLGVTPFMTFLAAFQLLLARHAGVDEVCVGTPVAGRNRTELEALIGLFVNTLVLRTDLSGDPSFEQLLARVREVSLGAYEHQDVPFDQVVDALQPPRDLGRTPLFQVAFALQNVPLPALSLDELTLSLMLAESNTSKFDLSLTLAGAGETMQGWLEFNTDLFDRATIARMAGHYLALLESAAREPSQPLSRLRMLPEPERDELLRRWNPAPPPLDVPQLHRRFEAHATLRPDAEAVVAGQLAPVSYGALNRRANQVARELILTAGVRPGDRVALGAARADEALVGLLAILKAGAAVALAAGASEGPAAGWALTAEWMAARADGIAAREESDLPIDLPAEAAAVVASGCSIDHLTVGHALDALAHALDLASSDRLWVEGGDGACIQLLLAVVAGAAVVASDRPEADSHGAGSATVAWLSSSTLDAPALADASALRAVALTAPCAPELLARWNHCRIVPVHQVLPGLWLLEEPQPGLERYLLDQLLMPVPVGVTAELYLAAGLSPDAPEATARFCPHPFSPRPGALLYRTGERARYTASGRLLLHDRRAAAASAAAAGSAPVESHEFVPPRTPIEQTLAQFWREVLGVERVSVHDNFFLLGGNSLLSMLVLHRIHETLQVEVPIHRLFETPTLAALASLIQTEQDAARDPGDASTQQRSAPPALLRIRAGEAHITPLFLVHGAGGSVMNYADLARHIDPARPFYGIHSPGLDGEEALPASVEAMARDYLAELRAIQPSGPYLLGGWSFGGVVAFEMAQQLLAAGETVATLALIDSYAPTGRPAPRPDELASLAALCSILGLRWQHLPWDLDRLRALGTRDRLAHVLDQLRHAGELTIDITQAERWLRVFERDLEALRGYTPSPYPGPAVLFRAEVVPEGEAAPDDRGWSAWITAGLASHTIPGDHHTMLRPPHVAALAGALTRHLNDAEARARGELRLSDRLARDRSAVDGGSAE